MSFLSMPITWLAGAAETTVRYVAGKMPVIGSIPVSVTCPKSIISSFTKIEHGGQELVFLFRQPWQWVKEECLSIEACKRAAERTFVPYVTTAANFVGTCALFTTGFFAKYITWPIVSSVAKGADDIAKWAVRDDFDQASAMQTIFSLAIIGSSAVAGYRNIRKCITNLRPDYKRQTHIMAAVCRLVLAGMFVCITWNELQALHSRASTENRCFFKA